MSDLPEGWVEAELADLTVAVRDGTHTPPKRVTEGVPLLSARNVQPGGLDMNEQYSLISNADFEAIERTNPVEEGDVLLTIVGSIGRSCVVGPNRRFAVQRSVAIIRPRTEAINATFLSLAMQSPQFQSALRDCASGSAQAGVYLGALKRFIVPVAPSAEQSRIVAKLATLLSKVDSCRERLDKIPTILKRFRQSVLAAACSGQLTSEWRNKNGRQPASSSEVAETKGLPAGWTAVPLGSVGTLIGGGTPAKDNTEYWSGSIPWVSPKDMKRNRISDAEDHISKSAVQETAVKMIPPGSILFVVRGMILNHTLPTAITETAVTINQDMKALVPSDPQMAEYLFLASRYLAPKILFEVKEATHGTRRIETATLTNWPLPLPPLDEQQEIVRRANQLLQLATSLETKLQKARQLVNAAAPALLASAFKGELVPTEAELAAAEGRSYETAAELLARIKSLTIEQQATPKRKVATAGTGK